MITEDQHNELKIKYDKLFAATVNNLTAWKDYYKEKGSEAKKRKLQIAINYQKKVEELTTQPKSEQTKLFEYLAQ